MRFLRQFWEVFDDRTGTSKLLGPVLSHPVPNATGWVGWTYALGSAVLIVFMVQVATGIALATAYIPSTANAYDSLTFITEQAAFGSFLRGTHNFGAWAMIVLVGLHMIQTFLIGAYKYPREVNWLSGAVLLLLTVALGFTGQLLRWDQTAYWSVFVLAQQVARTPVVGPALTELVLAGSTVNGATLSRFYAFHVFFIPALVFAFVALHIWLVLHTGVSEPPQPGRPVDPRTYRRWYHDLLEREGVPFWPDAAWRDVVLGVGAIVVIAALALVVGPPRLEAPPDPANLDAYPRPDWYLVWIFAALALVPPEFEDLVILGAPALFGLMIVLLPFIANRGERAPQRRPWAMAVVLLAVVMIGTLYVAGVRAPWSPDFDAQLTPGQVGQLSPSAVRGVALFNDKGCVACHRISGEGGERGPDLTNIGQRRTREQLTVAIMAGGGGMPAYAGDMTDEDLNALLALLVSPMTPPERAAGPP
jgi:ubiquinol-cytochrome c reductase cytochrome b subunit